MLEYQNYQQHGRKMGRLITGSIPFYDVTPAVLAEIHDELLAEISTLNFNTCRVYDPHCGAYTRNGSLGVREEPLMVNIWRGICRNQIPDDIAVRIKKQIEKALAKGKGRSGIILFDEKEKEEGLRITRDLTAHLDTVGMSIVINPESRHAHYLRGFLENAGLEDPDENPRTKKWVFSMGSPYNVRDTKTWGKILYPSFEGPIL